MIRSLAIAAALAAGSVAAHAQVRLETVERLPATEEAPGGIVRTLDRISGEVIDVEMTAGQTMAYGSLQVTLHECRYPVSNPSGDAYGLIQVVDARDVRELFAGWMVASSPALNALEHRRYDVWLLDCRSG